MDPPGSLQVKHCCAQRKDGWIEIILYLVIQVFILELSLIQVIPAAL